MIGRGNRSTRRKPAPVPLCPSQTPHAARTRTRAAAAGSQRLTAELRHGLPRGLRHELSSFARTPGSWVRIPLKAWISVYAFILCLFVLCIGSDLTTGFSLVQGVLPSVSKMITELKKRPGPSKGSRATGKIKLSNAFVSHSTLSEKKFPHSYPNFLRKILTFFSYLLLVLSSNFFLHLRYSEQKSIFLISSTLTTSTIHFIFLNLIALILLGTHYELQSLSLSNFLQPFF
jgi:hypothetical protein